MKIIGVPEPGAYIYIDGVLVGRVPEPSKTEPSKTEVPVFKIAAKR